MGEGDHNGTSGHEIAFEAYGVRLAVDASRPEDLERVREFIPPGAKPCPVESVERTFSLTLEDNGQYMLTRDGKRLIGTGGLGLDLALELLDTQLRIYLGTFAPDSIFIHAGVVGHRGAAIVLPSPSFGGKTTLVAELVKLGATYYSDEFGVLDKEGRVHAYAKRLSMRDGGLSQTHHSIESFGGTAGDKPLSIGLIAVTTYLPGAEWDPRELSAGAGAMALLENAVPAQERPDEVMHAISRAAKDARVIQSDRDEADKIAPILLDELDRTLGRSS